MTVSRPAPGPGDGPRRRSAASGSPRMARATPRRASRPANVGAAHIADAMLLPAAAAVQRGEVAGGGRRVSPQGAPGQRRPRPRRARSPRAQADQSRPHRPRRRPAQDGAEAPARPGRPDDARHPRGQPAHHHRQGRGRRADRATVWRRSAPCTATCTRSRTTSARSATSSTVPVEEEPVAKARNPTIIEEMPAEDKAKSKEERRGEEEGRRGPGPGSDPPGGLARMGRPGHRSRLGPRPRRRAGPRQSLDPDPPPRAPGRARGAGGWLTDPRSTVLLTLGAAAVFGGGRKLVHGMQARKAQSRLAEADVTPERDRRRRPASAATG